MKKELRCLIFDMDGTLVDSEKIYLSSYKRVFAEHNVAIADNELQQFSGLSDEDELRAIDAYTQDRALSEIVLSEMIEYAQIEFDRNRVVLKGGAIELLEYCQRQHLKLVLATSTRRQKAQKMLKTLGIFDYFDALIYGDEVSTPKPEPTIFLLALERSQMRREDCLVVEDSVAGVTAATRARMSVVQIIDDVDPVYFANYHVSNLLEIKKIIDAHVLPTEEVERA